MDWSGKESTRERLLVGASMCILERGLAATTSRDIAAASGANLAAITYHFGSKDALVAEALLGAVGRWLEPARVALATGGEPEAQAAAVVAALASALDEAREWVPAYLEAVVAARHHPDLAAGVHRMRSQIEDSLAAEIANLRSGGVLASWVVPEQLARVLLAMADGLAIQVALDPSADVRPVTAQALAVLLAARPRGAGEPVGPLERRPGGSQGGGNCR